MELLCARRYVAHMPESGEPPGFHASVPHRRHELLHRIRDGLRPGRSCGNPPVFLLEVAAALLTVLTVRDGIIGAATTRLELLTAVALWGAVLLAGFAVATHRGTPAD